MVYTIKKEKYLVIFKFNCAIKNVVSQTIIWTDD